MRTVITGGTSIGAANGDAAVVLERFAGVALDEEARGAIMAALEDCAARSRAAEGGIEAGGEEAADWLADDPDEAFVRLPHNGHPYRGTLEPPVEWVEAEPLPEGESDWRQLGAGSSHVAELMKPGCSGAG